MRKFIEKETVQTTIERIYVDDKFCKELTDALKKENWVWEKNGQEIIITPDLFFMTYKNHHASDLIKNQNRIGSLNTWLENEITMRFACKEVDYTWTRYDGEVDFYAGEEP